LIFLIFFLFLKASNINVDSTRKISDCKIYASKVERVQNTFENLNSFEIALKMLKTMQIYQKYIFWGFLCFLAIFWFFLKIYQNIGQKLGSNSDEESRRRWGEKTVVTAVVFSSLYWGMKFLSFLFCSFVVLSFSSLLFSSLVLISPVLFFFYVFLFLFLSFFLPLFSPVFFLFLFSFLLSSLPFSSIYLFVFVSRPLVFIRGKERRESYYPCPVMAQG